MPHHKSRTEYLHYGRIWLVVVFLILRGVDVFDYFSCYPAYKNIIIGVIINANVWSIVLLAGTWFRQLWARYTLIALMLIWLGLGFAFSGYLQEFFGDRYARVMALTFAGYIASALMLIAIPSIQRLTSRSFG